MRIGLITGEYPPMQGGVGDFTRGLADALIDLGHDAHIVTGRRATSRHSVSGPRRKGDEGPDEILVHRAIGSWGLGCWRQIADVARGYDLELLNIQYEPAAYAMQIGVNFLPGNLARSMIKCPIVTTFHDLLVPYLFPKAGALRWKVVEYLARRSDAVIVTNEEDRTKLSNLQPLISNLHLVPIGSNIDPVHMGAFECSVERARWGVQPGERLLGYFGFLNLSKGGPILLRALRVLVDEAPLVKLLLIGGRTGSSDPANVEYATRVDHLVESLSLKDRVIVTGYLDLAGVSRAFMACDVIALPYADGASLRRGSLMAAIAHGRAIVTTMPTFPIEGLTHNQSALFVPPNDPLALASAIRRVLADLDLRTRLEHGASQAAMLYTWDRLAQQTAEVYRTVMR